VTCAERQPRAFAVSGRPVAHSRSPLLFRAAFAASGLDQRYFRLAADDGAGALRLATELGLAGLNVTAPFKAAVADRAAELDEAATALAAVNLVRPGSGGWRGENTDAAGVVAALRRAGQRLAGRRAVVLGSGGAGRAAAWGLLRAGARVCLVNRTAARAQRLAERWGCAWARWSAFAAALADAELLVSCLPRGVAPPPGAGLGPGLTVLDANYAGSLWRPPARRAGCGWVDGLEWLLAQAELGFERWLDRPAPAAAMRRALDSAPAAPANIALFGFMGSGKTSLGRALADRKGRRFIDLDALVAERAGCAVADIFARRGEAAFRALERAALERVSGERGLVLACGGGCLLEPANRALLGDDWLGVWLWAPLGLCLERCAGSQRPLLGGDSDRLWALRAPGYAARADLVLDGSERGPAELAERMADELVALPAAAG
jgi:shikimate dehydrogenase